MNSESHQASDRDIRPNPGDVELFARFAALVSKPSDQPHTAAEDSRAIAEKWENSLRFIKDTGERLRDAQRRSEQMTSDAYEIARKAIIAMQEERERANHAEVAAADAMARAKTAESELQALKWQLEQRDAPPTEIDQWLREAHARLQLARRNGIDHP